MTDNRPESERILLVFAHPDDESFGQAATLAMLDDLGVPATLVSATRGEAGQISDPDLATPENLGPVRERELRQAMAIVGVEDIRFLGYRDSGMDGTPENDDPRALTQAPEAELVAHLIGHIRDVRPTTVLTFGPDGVYGHPDHVRVHYATVAAVAQAADGAVLPSLGEAWRIDAIFYAAAPRERMLEWHVNPDSPFSKMPREAVERMGTPSAEITHWFDARPYTERKRAVLSCHRTQVGLNGPMADWPPEMAEGFFRGEQLRRVPLPWDGETRPQGVLDHRARSHPYAP
jgi:N-acetyl-1-D-myo-inositol-2-amino-2-deoxy-alpha-D-glucopyranoside deacetylase